MTAGVNGDYDSDTMLITDNELLISAARRNYDIFNVPTSLISAKKTVRYYTNENKADLDIKTSVNKIGEIINLSQQLNSLLWETVYKGAKIGDVLPLYCDICKLAVLSGVAIDSAKKEFDINQTDEIRALKDKYKLTDDSKTVKPMFFKMITLENGYALSENIKYKYFHTPMDYLQKIISKFNFREGRENKRTVVPFMDIVKEPSMYTRHSFYYGQCDRIIEKIRAARDEKKKLFIGYDQLSKDEKTNVLRLSNELRQECIEEVMNITKSPATMYLILKTIDKKETSDVSKFVFEVLFGRPDQEFFKMIKESRSSIYTLQESCDGDIEYYNFHYKKVPLVAVNET